MATATDHAARPILVALDLKERSMQCLSYACEMAARFDQPLIVAHVVHETDETLGMYRRYSGVVDTRPLQDIARQMLEEYLDRFRASKAGSEHSCDIKRVVVDGVPETRIPALAKTYDAGMIVLRSHNRHGFRRWLTGSVSEAVMRNAECPVVVVGDEEGVFSRTASRRPVTAAAQAA